MIDLVADGPHALIAGTTGAGKSELLRTLVASLAAGSPPDLLSFVLIDFKGGSAFDRCADLPHTVGLVTDLDEHLAGAAPSAASRPNSAAASASCGRPEPVISPRTVEPTPSRFLVWWWSSMSSPRLPPSCRTSSTP